MRDLPVDENYYEKVLDNFEQFCDQFEGAASQRFSGVDNDSRQPVDNAEVQRVTPAIVREVESVGEEDVQARAAIVDVQASGPANSRESS